MPKQPSFLVDLGSPVAGYWDGGAKQRGEFVAYEVIRKSNEVNQLSLRKYRHPGEGKQIIWGCWEFNLHFKSSSGKNWNHAKDMAIRKLRRFTKLKFHVEK